MKEDRWTVQVQRKGENGQYIQTSVERHSLLEPVNASNMYSLLHNK